MAKRRASEPGAGHEPGAGLRSRIGALLGRHRAVAVLAAVVLLVALVALVVTVLARPWQGSEGPGTGGQGHETTTAPPPTSGPTTAPASTSTTSPAPTARSTPALYPAYLPAGVPRGSLLVDAWSPPTFGGYVQSYEGTRTRGQSLPELVIGGPQAEQMFATSGHAPESTVLAGYPVTVWRIVSAEQAAVAGGATVTGLTATVAGRVVSLIGVSLTDAELASVLHGLHPRPVGPGWVTDELPATLVLVAQGERSEDPSFVPYRVQFAPDLVLGVTHDVVIPRGACVCNAESWPVELTRVRSVRATVIDLLPTGDQAAPLHQIEWQYSPDADVTLTYGGISTEEALRIAASVQPASPTVWASLPCTKNAAGVGAVACDPEREVPTAP
ncbi:MAG: hypothetical protein M0007_01785 [Actinomycetota bacterium]|nr:hypothetical protein [Actinomycetota bacterium]